MAEKALVVEEDFLMRGYAVDSLQRDGAEVVEACTLEEARCLLASQHFDYIFADLKLWESGDRMFKKTADTLRIVMTSYNNVERAIQSTKAGSADDYLVKPFSSEQVSFVVSRSRELMKLRARLGALEAQVDRTDNVEHQVPSESDSSCCVDGEMTTNLQDLERQTIIRVLHETQGRRSVMAEKLGISVRTLRNKLTQYKQEAWL